MVRGAYAQLQGTSQTVGGSHYDRSRKRGKNRRHQHHR